MNELNRAVDHPDIFQAISDSIGDARDSVKQLAGMFAESVTPLRMEESEDVFLDLSNNIQELACFIEFKQELQHGLSYYDRFGLPEDPISSDNSGLNLFRQMHNAMESKDWVVLSDLIEYELSPLLLKEEEWLGSLNDRVVEIQS